MRIKALYAAIPTVLGLIVILSYLNVSAGLIDLPNKLVLMLVFAIGPAAIYGVTELSQELKKYAKGATLKVGVVFLTIGFALLNLMLVVQQTIFIMTDKYITEATDAVAAESMRLVAKGVNLVQIGIDISFDIFYSLGLIMVASVIYRHPHFGKFLGIFGIIAGSGLLALNMHTFPIPPAESGLIDLGPLTALWWLTIIVLDIYFKKKEKKLAAA